MKLFPIYATGIKAYCSDIIVDPDEPETAYFVSVCGYQATVKGIIANFLERQDLHINLGGTLYYLSRADHGYKMIVKKMPSGLIHGVLFPRLALPKNKEDEQNSFFIFTEHKKDIPSLFYLHLDERIEIPMHPSWANWLWQVFEEKEDWLFELNTLLGSFHGYLFKFNPKQLQDIISTAIRQKIPQVVKCMKGGNGHGKLDIT